MPSPEADRVGPNPTWPPPIPVFDLPSCLDFLKLKQFPLKIYPAVYDAPKLDNDTLYIYGPGFRNAWASFDVDCLQYQIYLRFCGVEFDVHNSNEPDGSPSGKLPFLATVTGAVYDEDHIHQWLDDRGKAKQPLNEQAKAFIAMTRTKLYPAWLFSMWVEPLNYNEITSKAYFGHVPGPVNQLLSYRKQNQVVQSMLNDRDVLVREEIYQEAAQALEALSVKLGDDTHFYGAGEPTWLDAVVFGQLHAILSAPSFPGTILGDEEKKQARTLRSLVHRHENLVQYAKNMYETWLK